MKWTGPMCIIVWPHVLQSVTHSIAVVLPMPVWEDSQVTVHGAERTLREIYITSANTMSLWLSMYDLYILFTLNLLAA